MHDLAASALPEQAWIAADNAPGPVSACGCGIADSIAMYSSPAAPQTVFGPDSWATLLYQDPSFQCNHPFSGTWIFQCLTAVLLVAYCFLAAGFPSSPGHLFKQLRNRSGSELLASEQSHPFEQFLRYGCLVGLLAFSLGTVRFVEICSVADVASGRSWLAVPVVLGTAGAVLLYQWVVLRSAGRLTGHMIFMQNLYYLKKLVCSFGTIIITPVLLLFALSSEGYGAETIGAAILTVIGSVVLVFLWKSLRLFAQQKVSILYWFLYLCTVEILPVSFIILLVVKNA